MILRKRAALVMVAAACALLVLAETPARLPSRCSWDELDRWYLDVGPAAATIALLRLATQIAAAWLVLVSALQVVATGGPRTRLRAVADRLAPRFLRSVACGAATLSLGVGLGGPAAGGEPRGTAEMVPLDVPATTSSSTTTTTSTIEALITTTTEAPITTTTTSTTTAPAVDVPPPAPPADVLGLHEVVVEPGGSFWSIAEQETGGRAVGPFWRALIELNRDRLVDPSNPDLLYPGQVLRLPS